VDQAVFDWIRWNYRKFSKEEFMDSIEDLEMRFQKKFIIHEILQSVRFSHISPRKY
jgi:hypothetical protein